MGDVEGAPGQHPGVDIASWSHELLGNLRLAGGEQAANQVVQQFLRAFETQAVAREHQKRNSVANANRILIKTLQRIHRQHKELVNSTVPGLQRDLEDARRRAETSESRLQVLQCHL